MPHHYLCYLCTEIVRFNEVKINHLQLWPYSPTSMICSRSARLNPTASSSRKAGARPPSTALSVRLPTILRTLVEALATIETDEERSFFLIDLPCRADMVENMAIDKIIRYNDSYGAVDFTKDFTKDFIKENESELTERQKEILILLADDRTLTSQKISQKISQKKPVSSRTIKTDLFDLQKKGIISREGGRKNGYWQLLFLPME